MIGSISCGAFEPVYAILCVWGRVVRFGHVCTFFTSTTTKAPKVSAQKHNLHPPLLRLLAADLKRRGLRHTDASGRTCRIMHVCLPAYMRYTAVHSLPLARRRALGTEPKSAA